VIDCIFCSVISKETHAHLVFEDESTVAFLDRSPVFLGHTLVVPKHHVKLLWELGDGELANLTKKVKIISLAIQESLGCDGVFVANNNNVSQSVPHVHFHVIPRSFGDGLKGFFWPRRRYGVSEAESYASLIGRSVEVIANA
jgi:histidine triad (HIT) family protein